jgi:hypothetical protein
MFVRIWEKRKGIITPSKPQKIRIITKGNPPLQHIQFKNLIDGRAYIEKYKDGFYYIILEFKGIKGMTDWQSLIDEVNWGSEVLGKAELMEVYIPDQISFPIVGTSFLGVLKLFELFTKRRR